MSPYSPMGRHRAPSQQQAVYRRRRIGVLVAVVAAVVALLAATGVIGGGGSSRTKALGHDPHPASAQGKSNGKSKKVSLQATTAGWTTKSWLASLEAKVKGQQGHLQPGSNPAVLPGPVLIADRNNNRLLLVDPKGRILWQFPAPGSPAASQNFLAPDDAFFGPHGRHIIITQESQFTVTKVSLRTGQIVWHYGHPGTPGAASGYLDNPDDAMELPNGNVMLADIKNCRLLEVSPNAQAPLHIYGMTDQYCYHAPPTRFGSPNGMFPMTDGNWLVTEINGDWVDKMTPSGSILWSVHPPGITYPSDTNEVSPGVYLTAAYTDPGAVEEFNSSGQLLWRYAPAGPAALNKPSLALPLPNGDVLVNDDWNHRVIVIDPKTNQVVWQYGVTGVAGSAPGYLNKPDGVDVAPPYSLLVSHAATMGTPPFGG